MLLFVFRFEHKLRTNIRLTYWQSINFMWIIFRGNFVLMRHFFELNQEGSICLSWMTINETTYQLKTMYCGFSRFSGFRRFIGPRLIIILNYMISIHKSINACPWTVCLIFAKIPPKIKMPIQMRHHLTINL